jgi:hypothetical protein
MEQKGIVSGNNVQGRYSKYCRGYVYSAFFFSNGNQKPVLEELVRMILSFTSEMEKFAAYIAFSAESTQRSNQMVIHAVQDPSS